MTTTGSGVQPQTIEELKSRFEQLEVKKQAASTEVTRAEERLKVAKKNAKETYGTDDVEELKVKLEEWKVENERLRREYQSSLDTIEAELERVKSEHEGAE
jgi:hypothetical protein